MSIDFSIEYEEPDWSAPDCVRAVFTHRRGGHSKEPFDSANLGLHVGDIESDVLLNRALISEQFKLPAKPAWMTQIHSNRVIEVLHGPNEQSVIEGADGADGAYTNQSDPVLVMMVADCLPVLLTDDTGDERA